MFCHRTEAYIITGLYVLFHAVRFLFFFFEYLEFTHDFLLDFENQIKLFVKVVDNKLVFEVYTVVVLRSFPVTM